MTLSHRIIRLMIANRATTMHLITISPLQGEWKLCCAELTAIHLNPAEASRVEMVLALLPYIKESP
ncbi:hypothetical protein [Rhizobium sp. RCAM05973]|uniref:hypothetical protein n=1 Tax=Rhizobium sp. RCAM05973 TaxID=2994066 RepID=UPI0022EC01AD|nr:hypothetical protein [Rhizobium sp. RCAM05973]